MILPLKYHYRVKNKALVDYILFLLFRLNNKKDDDKERKTWLLSPV